jgi:hypothetical protein
MRGSHFSRFFAVPFAILFAVRFTTVFFAKLLGSSPHTLCVASIGSPIFWAVWESIKITKVTMRIID